MSKHYDLTCSWSHLCHPGSADAFDWETPLSAWLSLLHSAPTPPVWACHFLKHTWTHSSIKKWTALSVTSQSVGSRTFLIRLLHCTLLSLLLLLQAVLDQFLLVRVDKQISESPRAAPHGLLWALHDLLFAEVLSDVLLVEQRISHTHLLLAEVLALCREIKLLSKTKVSKCYFSKWQRELFYGFSCLFPPRFINTVFFHVLTHVYKQCLKTLNTSKNCRHKMSHISTYHKYISKANTFAIILNFCVT